MDVDKALNVASLVEMFWREKREVMAHYNTIEPSYDMQYGEEQSKKHEVALQVLGSCGGEMILDVGCGTGLLFFKIAGHNASIVGVDFSRKMLRRAVERFRRLKNVHFICGDVDFLPLRENVFDKVFSFTLLQNMPMPKITLEEVVRVAKRDSTLVLTGQKKSFLKDEFLRLLRKANLLVIRFFEEELKDYVAICKRLNFYSKTA